jgi:hypothetical protein
MIINEAMNLVVPIVSERVTEKVEGKDVSKEVVRIYGYSIPIPAAVFESNYRILAATKSALASKGLHYAMNAGPRIAALTLRDEGLKDAESRGLYDEQGVVVDKATDALFAEIKRLTMILCPGPQGWDTLPVDAAISRGVIDAEDWQEAIAAIVFFTVHHAMARKADRQRISHSTAAVLGGSTTSLPPMEFLASLPTSTPVETSAKRVVSSVPC